MFMNSIDKFKLFLPLILAFIIIFFICVNRHIKSVFGTDNITRALKNSEFAGYAIFINKQQLLTAYNLTETTCKNKNIYILYNNNYYGVFNKATDLDYGLSILELKTKNDELFKNYAILSNTINIKKLLTVKSSNNPFNINLHKINFKNINNFLYKKSFDVFSQQQGAPLLDSNLSLYGTITGRTKNGLSNIFSNELNATNNQNIKSFLDKQHIEYKVNIKNVNLKVIKNYKDKVIAKVICVEPKKRISRTITLPR